MTKIGVIVTTRKLEVKCILKVVYIFSKRLRGQVNIDPLAPPGGDSITKIQFWLQYHMIVLY